MRYYVYILADENRENIHTGYSTDIQKAILFYKQIPSMKWPKIELSRLVYLEMLTLKDSAEDRLNEINKLTKVQKQELISSANPDFLELIIGVNIEI